MFGREASEDLEVIEFEAPRRYCVDAESHGCRYHSEFLFTEKDGGTQIDMSFEATPLTTSAKLMSVLMKPMMKTVASACARDLDDLKAALEGQ